MVNSEQSDSYLFLPADSEAARLIHKSYQNIRSESGWIVHMDRWTQCWLGWTVALLRWHYMTRNADRLRLRWFFGCQMTPWIGVAFVGYVHLHAFTIVYICLSILCWYITWRTCANCREMTRYASWWTRKLSTRCIWDASGENTILDEKPQVPGVSLIGIVLVDSMVPSNTKAMATSATCHGHGMAGKLRPPEGPQVSTVQIVGQVSSIENYVTVTLRLTTQHAAQTCEQCFNMSSPVLQNIESQSQIVPASFSQGLPQPVVFVG